MKNLTLIFPGGFRALPLAALARAGARINRATSREAADLYLLAGLKMCAIAQGTKAPNYRQWEQFPIHLDQIHGRGLGLLHALSGTCAIDIDDLLESVGWLAAKGIDLVGLLNADDAVQIQSGRPNRAKLMYRLPDDLAALPTRKLKTTAGATMIEFRCASSAGASMQDVLPPTIHPDTGQPYKWGGAGDFTQLPELPAELLAIWSGLDGEHVAKAPKAPKATPVSSGKIPEGGRNDALYKQAGDLARQGLALAEIDAALQAINAANCIPPLPSSEVSTIARSASVTSHGAREFAAINGSEDWPELQPLIAKLDSQEYPINALPEVIRGAVLEVAGFAKAPIPLIAASALSATSLAIQAFFDVLRADKLSGPSSLFLLSIADSGERKSTCDGFFTKEIREYEAREREAAKPLIKAFKSEFAAWEAKRSGLKEQIKALAKENKPCTEQEQALHELDKAEPMPPRVPRLIYGDATPEALIYSLAKSYPSGGVISSEAGSVFGGHGMSADSVMRNLATLNQLWDGATLAVERRSSESFIVRGARLTMGLQVQEATIRTFFANTKGLARGTGFLARFLVSLPHSTQGRRPFTEAPQNWPALTLFNDRLKWILSHPIPIDEDGTLTPAMLTLAPDAKAAWVAFHDAVELELSNGRVLYDVRDVASKTADNAARLAALLYAFSGGIGQVDVTAMQSAVRIAAWHLNEARRFLGELSMPPELANPARLESWMLDYCMREKTDRVPTRQIQQFGPSGLRDKEVFRKAVSELADLGRARFVQDVRKRAVQINPALLIAHR